MTALVGEAGITGTKIIKSSYLVQSTKSFVEAETNVGKIDVDNTAKSDAKAACEMAKNDGKTPAKVPAASENPVNSDVQRNSNVQSNTSSDQQRPVRFGGNPVNASSSGSSSSATAGPPEADATDNHTTNTNAVETAPGSAKHRTVLNLSKPLGLVSTPGITLRGGSLRVASSDNLHGIRARSVEHRARGVELVKPEIHVSGFGTGLPSSALGHQKPELSVPPLRDLSITAGRKIRDVSNDGMSGTPGNSYSGMVYQSSAERYQSAGYQPSAGHSTPAGYQASAGGYHGSSGYQTFSSQSSNNSSYRKGDMSDIRAIAATGRSDGRLLESVRAEHFSRRKEWHTAQQEAARIEREHQHENHDESNSIVGKIMKQLNSTEQILRSVRDPPKQEQHLSSQRMRPEKQYGGEFNPFLPNNVGQAPGRSLNLAEIAQGISYIRPGNFGAPPQLGQPLTTPPVNLPSGTLPSASLPVAAPLLHPSAIATPVSHSATPVNPAEIPATASSPSTSFHDAKVIQGSNSAVIKNLTSSSSARPSKQKTASHDTNEKPQADLQTDLQVGQQNATIEHQQNVKNENVKSERNSMKSEQKHAKSREPSVVEQRKHFPKVEQPAKEKTAFGIQPLTVPSLIKLRSEEVELQPESAVDTEVGLEQSVEQIKKSPDSNTHIEPTLKAALQQESVIQSSKNENCLVENGNCLWKNDKRLTTNECSMPNVDACVVQNEGNLSDKLCGAQFGMKESLSNDIKNVEHIVRNKNEPEGTFNALLAEIDLLRGQLLDEQQLRSVAQSRIRLIEHEFRDREHAFLQREQVFEEREQQFSEREQQFHQREDEFQKKLEAKESELHDKETCIKSLMKVFGSSEASSGEMPKLNATMELPIPSQPPNSFADYQQRNSSRSSDSVDDKAPLELPLNSEFGSKDSLEPYRTAYEQKPTKPENQNSYQERTLPSSNTLPGNPSTTTRPSKSNASQKRPGTATRDGRRDTANEGNEPDPGKVKRSTDPDAEIQRYVRVHPDFPYAIEKIGNGQYVFGREKKEVYKRGNKFFVRVGGGSEQLHEYMENLRRKGLRV